MFKNGFVSYYSIQAMFLTFIVLVISVVPFPFLGNIFIPWFITVLFIWQCDNDYTFNPIFIFLVSLIFDFFSGGLLGLTSFLFLVFVRLVYNNRFILRGQTFTIKWLVFVLWILCVFLLQYIISSIAAMSLISFLPFFINLVLLGLTYPMFYKLSQWIENYE